MQTKFFRIMALVAMLTISIGPSYIALAADTPTSATVQAGGSGGGTTGVLANIECKWELPDRVIAVTAGAGAQASYPDPFIQYGTVANPHDHDDDNAQKPTLADGTTATTPCALPATGSGTPTQLQNDRHMIQVKPAVHDQPELVRIQLWAAIDAPLDGSGIVDVNWDIYHPDGTLKTEKHGTLVPVADCARLGTSGAVGTMFEAAVDTGQVAISAVDDPSRGLAYWCTQGKRFYYASFQISKHQPCGEYKVLLNAVAGPPNNSTAQLTNFFDVLCTRVLNLDFNAVNYGVITPGGGKVIPGDLVFEAVGVAQTPGPVMPTVRNEGNSGMTISVKFTDMVRTLTAAEIAAGVTADRITSFDACFAAAATYKTNSSGDGLTAKPLFCKDPIASNTTTTLRDPSPANFGNQTLCANRVGKLDLSIHPQSGIQPGVYTGTLTVLAVISKLCLTDNGHVDTTSISGADNPGYPGVPVGDGLQPGDVDPAV